jgi:alanine-glyoxylate transaminase/serine-glyoxylate transaminase/serine-pyruvate transaminase
MIGYLDPDFMLILDETSELLKRVFQTDESLTLALSGTGSEGLEARFERHRRNAAALRAGLEALGLELVAPAEFALDQITSIWIPDGVDGSQVREVLLRDYSIEIGAGLGKFAGKIWRIGLMGESSRPEYVLAVLAALEDALSRAGCELPRGVGVASASDSLAHGIGTKSAGVPPAEAIGRPRPPKIAALHRP